MDVEALAANSRREGAGDYLARELSDFGAALAALAVKPHPCTREALLLRLCFGGATLKSALELDCRILFSPGHHYARLLDDDRYFSAPEARSDHLLGALRRRLPPPRPDSPLFPSRRSAGPITPREAERSLRLAVTERIAGPPGRWSFRNARHLGKIARASAKSSREAHAAELTRMRETDAFYDRLIHRICWFFDEAYKDNSADRDDAIQETLLALRTHPDQPLTCTDSDVEARIPLALAIARKQRSDFIQSKKRFPRTNRGDIYGKAEAQGPASPGRKRTSRVIDDAWRRDLRDVLLDLSRSDDAIAKACDIVMFEYGILDGIERSPEETADRFGVSRDEVFVATAALMEKVWTDRSFRKKLEAFR